MDEHKLNITFDSDYKSVDMVRAAIEGILLKLSRDHRSESLAEDFCMAATEAMNNAVEHSGSRAIKIEISLNEKEIILKMMTEGKRFDPTAKAEMPLLDKDELPEGGFGLAMIHELVDSMHYEYLNGMNIFTIAKNFLEEDKEG